MVAALTATVGRDLLVREHGAERRAPVHRLLRQVREPAGVDERAPRERVEIGPPDLGVAFEDRDQLGDRAGPLRVVVVPGVEDLEEDPLRPPVVGDVGGGDAPTGVVTQAERPQLALHVGDVRLGRDPGVLTGLHRVLLGGEPERVVAHRVEHVEAGHPLEPGVDVGADVAQRVADVQTRPARVREHVEHVELLAVGEPVESLGEGSRRVRGPEGVLGLPTVLPLALDLVGEGGRVSVLRYVAHRHSAYAHRFTAPPSFWSGSGLHGNHTHDQNGGRASRLVD